MRRAITTLTLLAAIATTVLATATPAQAYEVHISITGAGQITETTSANLVGSTCVTSANNPTGTIGKDCFAGTPTGDYGWGWTVRYVASAKPGYHFVHWQSDGSGVTPVVCDGATTSTYTGSACQFSTFDNLQLRAVFADDTAPAIASLSGPNQPVGGAATFNFSATADPTLTGFECRVAGVHDWMSCLSGRSENPASSGTYTFEVRAVDASGNRSAPSTWSWTVDKLAPETNILSGPTGPVASALATFELSSNEPGTFMCSLDSSPLAPCSSPVSYSGLPQGPHTFRAAARDGVGNIDLTPASRAFTVDTTAPETTISDGPTGSITSDAARFDFSSSEEASYTCVLDGSASACTSPVSYAGLTDGSHSFSVTATDTVGNVDPTPATRTWTVDTVRPTTSSWGPTGKRVARTARPTVTFSEPMDEASVEARRAGIPTSFVLLHGTRKMAATVAYRRTTDGRYVATLTPARQLRRGTTYTVQLRSAARDVAGNALLPRAWKFRTRG